LQAYNNKALLSSPYAADAMTLYRLIRSDSATRQKPVLTQLGIKVETYGTYDSGKLLRKLLDIDGKQMQDLLQQEAVIGVADLDLEEHETLSAYLGIDMSMAFNYTAEYLDMYTKEQLIDLAVESKMIKKGATKWTVGTVEHTIATMKKSDLVELFLKEAKQGTVPSGMEIKTKK
jgi:hypothetical protein